MASDPETVHLDPASVLNVDKQTPPLLFHHGDNFRLEKLPADRTRVIYLAEPLPACRPRSGDPSCCSNRSTTIPCPSSSSPA